MKYFQTEFMLKDREVPAEKYEEMLCCLPPERMTSNAFLVGEASDYGLGLGGHFDARYELYFMSNEKYYYGGLATVQDFDTFTIERERCLHCNPEGRARLARGSCLTCAGTGFINGTID
jgi:hypothetical protein